MNNLDAVKKQLSTIAENAQTAPVGDAEALHNIVIDLIDATRTIAAAESGAAEATAPAALDFWTQIEAMKTFALEQIKTATEENFSVRFSPEFELNIVKPINEDDYECYAYAINENGNADMEREIKITLPE